MGKTGEGFILASSWKGGHGPLDKQGAVTGRRRWRKFAQEGGDFRVLRGRMHGGSSASTGHNLEGRRDPVPQERSARPGEKKTSVQKERTHGKGIGEEKNFLSA